MSGFHAVICGGGVAAIEGMLRLRNLVGDQVDITLVAPNDDFVYRPEAVREATGVGSTRRYRIRDIARDAGADWIKDTLRSVDSKRRAISTGQGNDLSYDALLVAVGANQVEDLEDVLTFRDAEAGRVSENIVEDLLKGRATSSLHRL